MTDFDRNIARKYLRSYMPSKHLNYLLANLKPGNFHIWVGNGNNGKSTFAKVVAQALNGYYLSYHSLLNTPINNFSHSVYIVEDDDSSALPADRINTLLDAGFLVVLVVNTLPIVRDPNANFWARTHAIRFRTTFTTAADDPKNHRHKCDYLPPINLMASYLYEKMLRIQNNNSSKVPRRCGKELEQVKQLASHTICESNKNNVNIENQNIRAQTPTPSGSGPSLVIKECDDENKDECDDVKTGGYDYAPFPLFFSTQSVVARMTF